MTAKEHVSIHGPDYLKIGLPLLIVMGAMVSYLHLNFARASDVERIENKVDDQTVLLLKREIRSLRVRFKKDPEDLDLEEDIEGYLDRLCILAPEDRECRG